ncbi:hypothetical protein AAFF_G00026040 [Aldrovandia affinis]|uniref:Uncharacterized protein n=1 Tax=Aldrovandia affinis TaxID=143900 RepID=A0AAD7WGF9_9TELE|nr:hypothetical protein AAFF_G00026040 [Aldrovandia affinis]
MSHGKSGFAEMAELQCWRIFGLVITVRAISSNGGWSPAVIEDTSSELLQGTSSCANGYNVKMGTINLDAGLLSHRTFSTRTEGEPDPPGFSCLAPWGPVHLAQNL